MLTPTFLLANGLIIKHLQQQEGAIIAHFV